MVLAESISGKINLYKCDTTCTRCLQNVTVARGYWRKFAIVRTKNNLLRWPICQIIISLSIIGWIKRCPCLRLVSMSLLKQFLPYCAANNIRRCWQYAYVLWWRISITRTKVPIWLPVGKGDQGTLKQWYPIYGF